MWLSESVLIVQSWGPETSTPTQELPTVGCNFRWWQGWAGDSLKQQAPGSVGNSWIGNQDGEPQRHITGSHSDLHANTHTSTHRQLQVHVFITHRQRKVTVLSLPQWTPSFSSTVQSVALRVTAGRELQEPAVLWGVETRRSKFAVWLHRVCAHCVHTTESENHKSNVGTVSNVLFSRLTGQCRDRSRTGLYFHPLRCLNCWQFLLVS